MHGPNYPEVRLPVLRRDALDETSTETFYLDNKFAVQLIVMQIFNASF